MKLKFTKMHGIGNDYIYFNCLGGELSDPSAVAVALSPRRFSVGADGIVMICPSAVADAKMRMFNADGSEGKMCGNAIRCVGKYLYDNGIVRREQIVIETLSGVKSLVLSAEGGTVRSVTVDMGIASVRPADVPVLSEKPMIGAEVQADGGTVRMTAVSVGNPHAVLFLPEIRSLDLEAIGPGYERHPLFPDRVNTEFARVVSRDLIEMRVWERGSGETYACGTGACATAVAAVLNGYADYETPVCVRLTGGDLTIEVKRDLRVFMTGTATKVYDGELDYED